MPTKHRMGDLINKGTKFLDSPFKSGFVLEEVTFTLEYPKQRGEIKVLVGSNWIIVYQKDIPTYVFYVYEIQAVMISEDAVSVMGHETSHRIQLSTGEYETFHTR